MSDQAPRRSAGSGISVTDPRQLIGSTTWYHGFELQPGLFTPGPNRLRPREACDAFGVPADLTGKRVLDIGAYDGAYTFELERRGADVFALDIQNPARVGFEVARSILRSRAIHYQGSVYQVPYGDMANLDLIFFVGVLYHLKHPLLALERINSAMKMGATLIFETEALIDYAENGNHLRVDAPLSDINQTGVPLTASYAGRYKGTSNWFVPNRRCLEGWLAVSGFEVVSMVENTQPPSHQRIYGSAIKTMTAEAIEHPLV